MRLSFILFLLVAVNNEALYAQQHFTDCVHGTGHNATFIVPVAATPHINGAPLAVGDEIAAFTPDGTCAGVAVWKGRSAALTLWGRNVLTDSYGGFSTGDSLRVRIWDASTRTEYHEGNSRLQVSLRTDAPHLHTHLRYAPGAIYVVEQLCITLASWARR